MLKRPIVYFPLIILIIGLTIWEGIPKIHFSAAPHKHLGTIINPPNLRVSQEIKAVQYTNHNGSDTIIYPYAQLDLDNFDVGATICFRHTNEDNQDMYIEFTGKKRDIIPWCYFHILKKVPSQK